MSNDIHFHIPQGFSGTLTIGDGGRVTVTSTPVSTTDTGIAEWPGIEAEVASKLEEMLSRQKGYDPTTRSRDIAKVLLGRGWHIYSVNLKGAYILFTYAGTEHSVSLYLSSLDLNNTKAAHRDFMQSLPGADVHASDVRVPFNGKHYKQALDNITAIEKWADG